MSEEKVFLEIAKEKGNRRFSWRQTVISGHVLVILLSDLIKATFIFWPILCD